MLYPKCLLFSLNYTKKLKINPDAIVKERFDCILQTAIHAKQTMSIRAGFEQK